MDVIKFQTFFEFIFEEHGFRIFFQRVNGGGSNWTLIPSMAELGARQGPAPGHYPSTHPIHRGVETIPCCFELGLVKPAHLPLTSKQMADLYAKLRPKIATQHPRTPHQDSPL